MAELNWTNEAQAWLKDIYSYIYTDNPKAAIKVINGIYEKSQVLLTHPEIGYQYDCATNIRILLYGHYRIAYLIKENNVIDILGVFHGSLILSAILTKCELI